jgi:hypothetical protein
MHMQVVKACLLKNSSDPLIRDIYEIRKARVTGFKVRWSGLKTLEALLPVAEHNVRFAAQKGTSGIGAFKAGPYIGNPTIRDWREKVTEALGAEAEEKHVLHASCLPLQGVWTHWKDDVFRSVLEKLDHKRTVSD